MYYIYYILYIFLINYIFIIYIIIYIYDPKFHENPRVKSKTTCSPWTQLRQEAARDLSAHGAPGRAELVGDWDDILLT